MDASDKTHTHTQDQNNTKARRLNKKNQNQNTMNALRKTNKSFKVNLIAHGKIASGRWKDALK